MSDDREAFIPLDPAKRERSRAIAAEVARRLSMHVKEDEGES